jgi:tetratricopeptide (TPR) repeat protein
MHRKLLIVALSLFPVACASDGITAEQKTKLVDGFSETASQYFAMGEYDRANAQCIRGLQLDPDNTRLKLVQAWSLQKRGTTEDIAAAERLFRELQSTGDFRAILGLAEATERRGLAFAEGAEKLKSGQRVTEAADPQKRIDDYEKESIKSWTESRSLYLKALEQQRINPDVLNGLVRVEMLLGNTAQALEWDDKLIATTQETLDYWNEQLKRSGVSTSDEKQYRGEVRARTKVATMAHLTGADLCVTLNRLEKALEHLDAAIALDPDRPASYARRAQVEKDLGLPKKALADIEKFIGISTLDPNHPDIQRAWRLRTECEELARGL